MHVFPRTLLAVSLLAVLAGCKPGQFGPPDKKPAADAAQADGDAIAGLPTEKERVSYMIGLDLAKSLEPVKDEVDLDTMHKALKNALAGGKSLMDDKQAQKVREAFGQKMQAKQIADMLAKTKKNQQEGAAFLAANGKKPGVQTTTSGLQYEVLTQGKGVKPQPTDAVRVHYKGTLLDGKTFDSSYDRGEPVVFPLEQVVPGWREGIALMPVGSKYRFWIPSALAYGEKGTPGGPIPPNATLVFEVELQDIVKPGAAAAAPPAG